LVHCKVFLLVRRTVLRLPKHLLKNRQRLLHPQHQGQAAGQMD
jgi:hypothetical protein